MSRVLALLVVVLLAGCQYPDITLKGEPRPALTPEQVLIVNKQPEGPALLGLVYAWSPLPVDGEKGYDDAVAKLRVKAASIGANMLYVPAKAQIGWPIIQRRWMWPVDRLGPEDEDVRPQELSGRAYYKAP